MVRNLEERALALIQKLKPATAHKVAKLWNPNRAIQVCELINQRKPETLADVTEVFNLIDANDPHGETQVLMQWAEDIITEKDLKRRAKKANRFENKTANRALYLPYPVFMYYQSKEKLRWRWDTALRSQGLLSMMVEHIHGPQAVPINVNMMNLLPRDEEGNQPKIPDEVWIKCVERGVAISGERCGITLNTPGWRYALKAFPLVADMAAYIHGLTAPVLPQGFVPECPITLRVLDVMSMDLETDGSGWYHPHCPQMQNFIAKYGLVPCQIRFINTRGVFGKGMLFPCDRSLDVSGDPCITLDWEQIKGKHKPLAKQRRKEEAVSTVTGYLGVIQTWKRRGTLKCCFEVLENLEVNPETIEIVHKYVDQAMARLAENGVEGLVGMVAKDDESMDLLLKLITQMKALGINIEATQIPRVKEAIEEKLGHVLWHIAQGAGIKYPRYVCRLDALVPPGRCVVSGLPPDLDVTAFRFPIVLAQGLTTLKTMEPMEHHLANGEEVPFQAVMNPRDLTTRMQGDDDGDIIGISTDPEMVKLFKHLDDKNVYHIEPDGIPLLGIDGKPLLSHTYEGLLYLIKDQRGPIGALTNARSRLKSAGLHGAGNGTSISCQESVDRAKRLPRWSNYRTARYIHNWTIDDFGEYHFSDPLPDRYLTHDGDFDLEEFWKWSGSLIKRKVGVSSRECTAWRHPRKRINPKNWDRCPEIPGVGNLVHIAHDRAWDRWQEMADKFKISSDKTLDLDMLLPTLLELRGVKVEIDATDWETYRDGLRRKSGLSTMCSALAKLRATAFNENEQDPEEQYGPDYDNESRQHRIRNIHKVFWGDVSKLSINEIATCWYMEATMGNPNNCFRVVAWPGSTVMKLLGIEQDGECPFLQKSKNERTRLQRFVAVSLRGPNPHERITEEIFADKFHHKEIVDKDGEGIALWDCPHCMETLQTAVVNNIRRSKTYAERQWLNATNTKLNS